MAKAAFWQRGETIDLVNSTSKVIEADTIQVIGKRIGVVAMEAAPGQKYSVNVVGVYNFPKADSVEIAVGAEVFYNTENGNIVATNGGSDILAGYATAAATSTDKTVAVKINA